MAELNFPANPQAGDTYDYDSKRYRYDGIKWTTIKFIGDTAVSIMDNHKAGTKEHSVSAIDWKVQISHRNLLINGSLMVWQRGASGSSTSNSIGPDRFKIWAAGANTNWSRAASEDFDSFLNKVGWGLKWWGDPASTQAPIEQRIESVNSFNLNGEVVTVSFIAKSSSNTTWSVELATPNAIDDWSTTSAAATTQTITVGPVAKQYSLTFNLNNARLGLSLIIRPSVSTLTSWVANVQLERGAIATPFEYRPYGYELNLCQRYCVAVQSISAASETIGIGGYATGSAAISQYFLPAPMRAVPKWVGGGVLSIASAGGVVSPVTSIDMRGSTLTLTANQTNTIGQSCYTVSSGASTGFRGFDAEL